MRNTYELLDEGWQFVAEVKAIIRLVCAFLRPPLQDVADLADVDPVAHADLALVDFIQLLLVQKPC